MTNSRNFMKFMAGDNGAKIKHVVNNIINENNSEPQIITEEKESCLDEIVESLGETLNYEEWQVVADYLSKFKGKTL